MTAQISDQFHYRENLYQIAGISGDGLINPAEFGIRLVPCSTALWRGFHCTYGLRGETLILKALGLCTDGDPPTIFGVPPIESQSSALGKATYRDLDWPVQFQGGLLLGYGFIQELYVHMGFHPAWKFMEVLELIFSAGELKEARDRSEVIKEYRMKLQDLPQKPSLYDEQQLERWIRDCFSLNYEWRSN